MTQITRVPVGLQGFLGTQAQGKNPSELSQVVAPVLDIGLFLSVQQEYWSEVGSIFATDTTLYETVPEGEVWIIRGVGVEMDGTGAGDTCDVNIFLDNIPNTTAPGNNHPLRDRIQYTVPATLASEWFYQDVNNVVAYAGSRLGFNFANVTGAGNFTPIGYVRYLKLEI